MTTTGKHRKNPLNLWFSAGLILSIIFSYSIVIGQSLENVKRIVNGDTIELSYDLISSDENANFEIRLYGITGNNRQRLFRSTGDVGRYIKSGYNKKITWVHNVELLSYTINEIAFDIQFTFLDPPISVFYPEYKSVLKRGETYEVKWLGGENVKLDLMRNQIKVATIGRAKNKGTFKWEVASNTKAGKNYRIRLTSEKNPELHIHSKPFKIRRKIPIVLKAIPIIGAATVALMMMDNDSDNPSELPEPISPN